MGVRHVLRALITLDYSSSESGWPVHCLVYKSSTALPHSISPDFLAISHFPTELDHPTSIFITLDYILITHLTHHLGVEKPLRSIICGF